MGSSHLRYMSAKRQRPVNIADLSVKLSKGMTAAGNSGSACYRWKPPALLHRHFHPRTGPATKVFGREGRGEGEPFSKKVFLPASFSLFKSPGACLPSPKQKNPRRSGDKKRPPRAESCKGVSNNLWQRPTFPHDVMQYHRRWRA